MSRFCLKEALFLLMAILCIYQTMGFAAGKKASKSNTIIQPSEAVFIAAKDSAILENEWGVKLIGIQLTAAGHMLDFRFQVLNARKAKELLDRKNKPLVKLEDGVKLEVPNAPFVGSLRQSSKNIKDGAVFNVLFGNPGKMVIQGQPVNIEIGRFAVKGIVVGEMLNPVPKIKKVSRKAARHG